MKLKSLHSKFKPSHTNWSANFRVRELFFKDWFWFMSIITIFNCSRMNLQFEHLPFEGNFLLKSQFWRRLQILKLERYSSLIPSIKWTSNLDAETQISSISFSTNDTFDLQSDLKYGITKWGVNFSFRRLTKAKHPEQTSLADTSSIVALCIHTNG